MRIPRLLLSAGAAGLMLGACSKPVSPPPTPTAVPARAPTDNPVQSNSAKAAPPRRPTQVAVVAPRVLGKKETTQLKSDGVGYAAVVACGLLPRDRVEAHTKALRATLAARGFDPKAIDAAYTDAYDNVIAQFPQAQPTAQRQICQHAQLFATAVGKGDPGSVASRF